MAKQNILFIDSGNTTRGPMAMALLRTFHPVSLAVSRGITVIEGRAIDPSAVLALATIGVDAPRHRSRQVTTNDVNRADIILCMTNEHFQYMKDIYPHAVDKINKLNPLGDVHDPYGTEVKQYQSCMTEINLLLVAWFADHE